MAALRNSARFSVFAFGLVLVLAGVAGAQPTGGGPGTGGTGGTLLASVPDVTVAPNTMFQLVVEVTDPNPIQGIIAMLNTDPSQVQLLSGTQGQGVLDYLTANGEPPQCDIIVDPGSMFGLIFFGVPYETAVFGTEILVITAMSPATPGSYSVTYMLDNFGAIADGIATVTVTDGNVAPKELVRGDVNDDGTCNISDPINLLGYLFAAGDVPNCLDSGDIDDNGVVGIGDAINLLSGIFGTGFIMDEACQADATDDNLGACDRADCQ